MMHNRRATILPSISGLLLACMFAPSIAGAVEDILDASGVRGGLVVCVGCDNPEGLVALRRDNAYLVQGLDMDPAAVANARKLIHSRKLYGPVSVDSDKQRCQGKRRDKPA